MSELCYEEKDINPQEEFVGITCKKERRKLIIAASVGNFLEIFDFTVYSFFAQYIGHVFFKVENPIISLLISLSVFGVGFLMRPLGSIFIGGYADKHGRKAGLFFSIMVMGLGSACIAFAPSYATIGIAAPILIIIGRLLQGFSAGGEIGAASSLLMESAPKDKKGFFVSWQFLVQGLSTLFGSLFAYLITSFLTEEQILSWGWRLPFIFSLLIIPAGFYIRKHIRETHQTVVHRERHPFKELLSNHLGRSFKFGMIIFPCTLLSYIMVFYMPHYLMINNIMQESSRFLLSIYAGGMSVFTTLLCGFIMDRIEKRKPIIIVSFLIPLVSGFFAFHFVENWTLFLIAFSITIFFEGFLMPVTVLFIMEGFEKRIRATATGTIYAVFVAIFGGTAQIVVTELIILSNKNLMAPYWYLGFSLIVGAIATYMIKEERHKD